MTIRFTVFVVACILAEAVAPGTIQSVFWRLVFPSAIILFVLDFTELGNRL